MENWQADSDLHARIQMQHRDNDITFSVMHSLRLFLFPRFKAAHLLWLAIFPICPCRVTLLSPVRTWGPCLRMVMAHVLTFTISLSPEVQPFKNKDSQSRSLSFLGMMRWGDLVAAILLLKYCSTQWEQKLTKPRPQGRGEPPNGNIMENRGFGFERPEGMSATSNQKPKGTRLGHQIQTSCHSFLPYWG